MLRALRSGAPAIALGGGSVLSETVRAALREHTVVWMDISDETAWARAAGDDRPLAADREAFCALHAERRPLYESIADAFLPEGDRLVRRARAGAERARRRRRRGRSSSGPWRAAASTRSSSGAG